MTVNDGRANKTHYTTGFEFPEHHAAERGGMVERTITMMRSTFPETVTPSEADTRLAKESCCPLTRYLDGHQSASCVRLHPDDAPEESFAIPVSAVRMLADVLTELARGHSVQLVPIPAELTTQQAADLLNVSRPYLVRLLDDGKIPSRKVGNRRRVRYHDLMTYKHQSITEQLKALEELAAQAQELNMGY